MKKRNLTALPLAAALTLGTLLAGCGGSGTAKKYDYRAEDLGSDAVTLNIVTKQGSSAGLSALKDAFEAEYPNVTVEVTTNYAFSGLESDLQNGDVDLYMGTYEYELWYTQYHAVWDSYAVDFAAEDVVDTTAFNADILAANTAEGHLYALPLTTGSVGLFANMELLQKCGIEKAPETVDELLAACAAVKAAGYQPFRCLATSLATVAEGMTQYEVTKDGKNEAFDAAALAADDSLGDYFATVSDFLYQCVQNGYLDTAAEVYIPEAENNGGAAQPITGYMQECYAFLAGDVAFYPNFTDVLSSLQKRQSRSEAYTAAPFTYNFIPVPTKYGAAPIRTASYSLYANKNSKNAAWVKKFLQFVFWRENAGTVGNAAIFADAQYCMSPYDTDKVFTAASEVYYPQFHALFKGGASCSANDDALLAYNGKGIYAGTVKYGLDVLGKPDYSVDILSAAALSPEAVRQSFVDAARCWFLDGHTYSE